MKKWCEKLCNNNNNNNNDNNKLLHGYKNEKKMGKSIGADRDITRKAGKWISNKTREKWISSKTIMS